MKKNSNIEDSLNGEDFTANDKGCIILYFQGVTILKFVINGNVNRSGTENYNTSGAVAATRREETELKEPETLHSEEMIRAIKETVKQGLWWSNRSWAVVYRVWQMKGYMQGFSQFINEVKEWGLDIGFECNYDAVQKPITSGVLVGTTDRWIANCAQPQAVNLANALLEILCSESS